MPIEPEETRTVIRLRTGTKICLLIAVALVAIGIYYFFIPVKIQGSSGIFGCGSASHPPASGFQQSTCQDMTHVNLYRTFLFVGLGILLAALGAWMFGVDRHTEVRQARPGHDRFEDEDPDDAEPRERVRGNGRRGEQESGGDDDGDDVDGTARPDAEAADKPRPRPRGRWTDDDDFDDEDDEPRGRARRGSRVRD